MAGQDCFDARLSGENDSECRQLKKRTLGKEQRHKSFKSEMKMKNLTGRKALGNR
jgi:hypothetical protein